LQSLGRAESAAVVKVPPPFGRAMRAREGFDVRLMTGVRGRSGPSLLTLRSQRAE